jgi:hypothetical protein
MHIYIQIHFKVTLDGIIKIYSNSKERSFFENIEQNYKLVPVDPLHKFLSKHIPVNITRTGIP